MPVTGRTSKYTTAQNNEWSGRTIVVLASVEEDTGLTIDEIKQRDIVLQGVTSQKMARILTEFVDKGLVVRTKNRAGRMTYRTVASMLEHGYDPTPYMEGGDVEDGGADSDY